MIPEAFMARGGWVLHPLRRGMCSRQLVTGTAAVDGHFPLMAGAAGAVVADSAELAHRAARQLLAGLLNGSESTRAGIWTQLNAGPETRGQTLASFEQAGQLAQVALFFARISATGLLAELAADQALCLGEYLAFERGRDVVLVLDGMPEDEGMRRLIRMALGRSAVPQEGPGSLTVLAVGSPASLPESLDFDATLRFVPDKDLNPVLDDKASASRFSARG
jgi:vacuolar-type H+-ATPase subunit B/Vma2